MAKPGPNPKPSNLKILNGNPSNRPLNENEANPSMDDDVPQPPDWLNDEAKKEWNRVVSELRNHELLTKVDHPSFAAYCQSYGKWLECEKILKQDGLTFETPNGHVQQRPEVSIANKALEQMRKYASDFGLTPSARAGLSVDNGANKQDEFLEFLQRKK